MKIYIAGRITGDADFCEKFEQASKSLAELGHTVLNPAALPKGLTPGDYMRICFAMLDSADKVLFLPDFCESKGAMLEYSYCNYIGKAFCFGIENKKRRPEMINCNNVENFFSELKRMCKSTGCTGCGISLANNAKQLACMDYYRVFPKEAVAVVQSWSDAHPPKTYLSDFVEKLPKAPLNSDGLPHVCPNALGYCGNDGCYGTCKDCWSRPLTEENQND